MIENLISDATFQYGVKATTREDAIRKAAQPLIQGGKIESNYVDAIVNSLEETGAYCVLVPHVALAHARTTDGALDNSLSVTVLDEPVVFENEINDPVKYVFILSTLSNENHLSALAGFSELLEDRAFFELLENHNNPEKVKNYIKNSKS